MAERNWVQGRSFGSNRPESLQYITDPAQLLEWQKRVYGESIFTKDGQLKPRYRQDPQTKKIYHLPEVEKGTPNSYEIKDSGMFGRSTWHPKEQKTINVNNETLTRQEFEDKYGHLPQVDFQYFDRTWGQQNPNANEDQFHGFLPGNEADKWLIPESTEIASAGDLSGLLASNPNQRTMDQILADWDSAYKTHESWDWQNPAARAAWDDYQSLKEKNAAANEAKSRAYSASGYMDDNLNWQYRLPVPKYTYEGEDAAYAAYDKAIKGGSYKDIAGYDEINRGGLEAYDNISKFEAEYNAMVDSWSNFYQTEDEPIGDTMGEIEISKNIPPGKGGSPGQPYQPPKEDPKNPYVPAPGKKLAEGHPYVSDDSDLPYNWDGSGEWKDDDELQKKIDSLIGPSGGFEAQLPTRLQDNLRRQQKARNIAQESWTIGRPSSNRQTRIPTLTEGGGMNRQRQTFRIT